MNLTTEDMTILAQQDMNTLAKWWAAINRFEWPQEIPNPEHEYVRGGRGSKIMHYIEEAIGYRECLREWNKNKMSDDEFNDFWRGRFEGHEPSRKRADARLRKMAMDIGT